jgi:hypothetical protein
MGTKSIQVPERFHAFVKANRKEGETMAQTLIRMTSGPDPEAVGSLVSAETADEMRTVLEERDESAESSRGDIVDRFETDDSG